MSKTISDSPSSKRRRLVRANRLLAAILLVGAGMGIVAGKLFIPHRGLRGGAYILSAWAALVAAAFWMAGEAHEESVGLRWFMQRFAIGLFLLPGIMRAISTSPLWLGVVLVPVGFTLLFAGTESLREVWRLLIRRRN